MISLLNGNSLKIPLQDQSVHCVITSPPYWGLRDYGLDDTGIGLESTPEEYIANMVQVSREIWRVLRDDGTFWLNLGDSYAGGGRGGNGPKRSENWQPKYSHHGNVPGGLKAKDLVGIPWRVALALQADGWYLRSDIIWHKPNPMPESVTDRPTKAHEYVFLMTKKPHYYYDAEAIKEQSSYPNDDRKARSVIGQKRIPNGVVSGMSPGSKTYPRRNRHTVWPIATQGFSGAHFATFPEKLVEPMIKAGTSEHGRCPECGKAWARVTEKTPMVIRRSDRTHALGRTRSSGTMLEPAKSITVGFSPSCGHDHNPVPCTVLDPFCGSGTTGLVSRRLGRGFVGLDLSGEYLQLARERLGLRALAEWETGSGKKDATDYGELPLFSA